MFGRHSVSAFSDTAVFGDGDDEFLFSKMRDLTEMTITSFFREGGR